MASYVPGDVLSNLTAENDLSAKQYYILEKGAAAGQADVCDGAGDKPIGVLQNKPTAGQAVAYMINGSSKVVTGAAVSVGDAVGTDGSGKAIAKTANNDWIIGRAKTASGGDGEIIEVELHIGQLGA